VLDTISDWVGEVDRKARKPYITKEIINKMDERRKWKNVNNEGRNTYQKTEEQTERATDKATMEYFQSVCDNIVEFQRTGRYDLMYMKTKELDKKRGGGDSKHWHRILARECNSRSETSTETLEELSFRALRSSPSTRKP
jgi:hypothetical protein